MRFAVAVLALVLPCVARADEGCDRAALDRVKADISALLDKAASLPQGSPLRAKIRPLLQDKQAERSNLEGKLAVCEAQMFPPTRPPEPPDMAQPEAPAPPVPAPKEAPRIAQPERDPKLMRSVLSALVCYHEAEVMALREELADHLAHPTAGDAFDEKTREFKMGLYHAADAAVTIRRRMKQARMPVLPCAREVKTLALCIDDKTEAKCKTDKMLLMLELAEVRVREW